MVSLDKEIVKYTVKGGYKEGMQELANSLIRKKWGIQDEVGEEAKKLEKGDTALCIQKGKIEEVTVKYHGKYVNDYNDTSNFIRVSGGGYTW